MSASVTVIKDVVATEMGKPLLKGTETLKTLVPEIPPKF